jgi:hypothetical protein
MWRYAFRWPLIPPKTFAPSPASRLSRPLLLLQIEGNSAARASVVSRS